jgi:hypothetical protein
MVAAVGDTASPVRRSAVGGVAVDLAEVEDEHAAASATRTPRQSCATPEDQHDTTTDAQIRAWRRRKTTGRSAG